MSKSQNIYFLSTGRSGSTFLYHIFKEVYPELNITHQTSGSRLINVLSNIPFPRVIRNKILKALFVLFKNQNLTESTVDPLLSMAILALLKEKNIENENIKIVHLVRDPRTFVTSFMNWKSSSIKKRILHHLIPFWQPSPRFDKNISFKEKITFNKFRQFCYVWNYKNYLFWSTFHNSANYKLIRFEDLTKSTIKQEKFLDLLEFLDLPLKDFYFNSFSKTKINKSDVRIFPNYDDWDDDKKNYIYNSCGSLMQNFGYDKIWTSL